MLRVLYITPKFIVGLERVCDNRVFFQCEPTGEYNSEMRIYTATDLINSISRALQENLRLISCSSGLSSNGHRISLRKTFGSKISDRITKSKKPFKCVCGFSSSISSLKEEPSVMVRGFNVSVTKRNKKKGFGMLRYEISTTVEKKSTDEILGKKKESQSRDDVFNVFVPLDARDDVLARTIWNVAIARFDEFLQIFCEKWSAVVLVSAIVDTVTTKLLTESLDEYCQFYVELMKLLFFLRNDDSADSCPEHLSDLCQRKSSLFQNACEDRSSNADYEILRLLDLGRYIVVLNFTDKSWTLVVDFASEQMLHNLHWKQVTIPSTVPISDVMNSVFAAFKDDMRLFALRSLLFGKVSRFIHLSEKEFKDYPILKEVRECVSTASKITSWEELSEVTNIKGEMKANLADIAKECLEEVTKNKKKKR